MRALAKRQLVYPWDLLRQMVGRDVKLRYRGSFLGVAWSLLNPLAQLLVFSFVFRFVLPLNIPNYTSFLFIGLLVWNWFQSSLMGATTVIVDGRALIRRPGFPAAILPLVSVTTNLVHFLLALPILFLFLWLTDIQTQPVILLLPFIMALQALFTLGLGFLVATFHVSFRDTQHLVGVFLFLLFYLTPIFYDVTIIPPQYLALYRLNPLLHLVEAYRAILLYGVWPPWPGLLGVALLTAVLLGLGLVIFRRASSRFAEEL
jgi:lipopolysaccharide transport system permease protein